MASVVVKGCEAAGVAAGPIVRVGRGVWVGVIVTARPGVEVQVGGKETAARRVAVGTARGAGAAHALKTSSATITAA